MSNKLTALTDDDLENQLDRIDAGIQYHRKRLVKLDLKHKTIWGEKIRRMQVSYRQRETAKAAK